MNIAIIGVGNVGSALATAATAAGHRITVSATTPEHAAQAAAAGGATPAESSREAVAAGDVVVLAVPSGAVAGIAAELNDLVSGKILVDVTNPLNDAYSDLTTSGTSAAEQLQAAAPTAKVFKAFNTVFAARHANPTEDGAPLDAFYAGDDDAAKATVAELASSLGYRPIDIGGLRMARSLEEMAFVNILLNARNGWAWQSGWKLVGPTG